MPAALGEATLPHQRPSEHCSAPYSQASCFSAEYRWSYCLADQSKRLFLHVASAFPIQSEHTLSINSDGLLNRINITLCIAKRALCSLIFPTIHPYTRNSAASHDVKAAGTRLARRQRAGASCGMLSCPEGHSRRAC